MSFPQPVVGWRRVAVFPLQPSRWRHIPPPPPPPLTAPTGRIQTDQPTENPPVLGKLGRGALTEGGRPHREHVRAGGASARAPAAPKPPVLGERGGKFPASCGRRPVSGGRVAPPQQPGRLVPTHGSRAPGGQRFNLGISSVSDHFGVSKVINTTAP